MRIKGLKLIKYALKTRNAWWFTASGRTKGRFIRTKLGSFWLGISLLLTVLSVGSLYSVLLDLKNIREYWIYLGIGLACWTLLADSICSAGNLFEANIENLKNLNLNPIFYVLEEWAFQVQSFAQTFGIILIFASILKPIVLINFFTYSLIHLLNLLIFALWFPTIICLLGVRFSDLFQLMPIFTQILFLLSPILYPQKNLGSFSHIPNYNFIYLILRNLRDSIIEQKFFAFTGFMVLLINLFMLILTFSLFENKKKNLVYYFG